MAWNDIIWGLITPPLVGTNERVRFLTLVKNEGKERVIRIKDPKPTTRPSLDRVQKC
jgi:hypothetical protein